MNNKKVIWRPKLSQFTCNTLNIFQHRVAKVMQAFTKRLKGCIASRGGRFEHRLQWDEKMMEVLVGPGCLVRSSQITMKAMLRYRDDKTKCSRSSKSLWNLNTQKPDDFWFSACDDAIWKGNIVWYIHLKGNCPLFQMPYLAKSYDASVLSYLAWKLGVTFF